jgi:RNA polymerase-interacting CarD/CdnL/TRCF family regulator
MMIASRPSPSFGEKKLYASALQILKEEIAIALGVSEAKAEKQILESLK